MRRRSGFSLVELLVVIAIIGMLVAMLLPAVQAAREAARRANCESNLRQVGIAVHGYHDVVGRLPYASIRVKKEANANLAGYHSAFMQILPYLEQAQLYQHWDQNKKATDAANVAVVTQFIPPYLCPSMQLHREFPDTAAGDANMAAGSYAVCAGTQDMYATGTDPTKRDGAFTFDTDNLPINFKHITDGTSQTFMAGEIAPNQSNVLFSSGPKTGEVSWGATQWAYGYAGYSIATTVGVFNSKVTITGSNERETFRSDHPQGAYFVYMDSSTRFMRDDVDVTILNALATRSGRELLNLSQIDY